MPPEGWARVRSRSVPNDGLCCPWAHWGERDAGSTLTILEWGVDWAWRRAAKRGAANE
jgi:hypothetical protein